MKHDEFQVKGHRFGNEVRALLRVQKKVLFIYSDAKISVVMEYYLV